MLLTLTACPSSDSPGDSGSDAPEDTTVADTATGDIMTPSDTGLPDAGPLACPLALPSAGDACARLGLTCDYGTPTCYSTANCLEGQWQVAVPDCPSPPADGCPATREVADGSACGGDEGSVCEYEDGLGCACTTCPNPYPLCQPVDPAVWACDAPNPDSACPPGQPLRGVACSAEALECDYGCEPGRRRVCTGGLWVEGTAPGGCPMSTRRAKRDIEYLGEAEVDALAAAAMSTRLTTYEYIDPALDGRRRLGFIIEDQPASYAVDPERSQVDLYGFTSMLVAAMQSQQRRIETLEGELRALQQTDE